MEHPSFARTDNSDTKLEENIRQPDFVILAKAVDTPLHCHSVWEVKTLYSYASRISKGVYPTFLSYGIWANQSSDPKTDPRRTAGVVMDLAIPQVSAQVLHAFHEYPTQGRAHCFILVDVYYRHLEYERSGVPRLRQDMRNDDIIKLAHETKPTFSGPISTALREGRGENGEEVAWFTIGFENAWQKCTRDFMERN